jgi:TolB-like protein/DNA-binding SARP family transcriptional activator
VYTLRLLGTASIEAADGRVSGRAAQGRRLALLALLALARGRELSRDKLVAMLWPEASPERARPQLSDALYVLRHSLGEDVVRSVGDAVVLESGKVTSDVAEFERLMEQGRLEEAVALYRGPLLDGFHLSDSVEFENWLDGERAALDRRYAGALEALAEAAEAADAEGAATAAVGWWRRRAGHDPFNGRVALRLMRALDASGDRAGALAHARIHATLLREHFQAEPDGEVMALADRLRNEPAPAPKPALLALSEPAVLPVPSAPVAAPARPTTSAAIRLPPAARPLRTVASRRRPAVFALAAVAVVIVAALGLSRGTARIAAPPPARSIAVLPFVNMSPDAENTYFSDGLSEQIILALSRIDGLQVAARTSSFALRNRELGVRAIADTLGVQAVLEGSVLVDGDRLRVIAQLIDAHTGYHLWSDHYDGELRDVFVLQDRLASAIADALQLRLTGSTSVAARAFAPEIQAYDLYLRGLYLRNSLSADALRQAAEYFDRAIQLEPRFAAAWAAKASVVAPQAYFRYANRDTVIAEMRTLTGRALQLDPLLGEAHVALGILRLFFDWDWNGAEEALLRAIELNPNDAHAWHHLANYHAATGSLHAALAARERSARLDPLNPRTRTVLAADYRAVGDHQRALEEWLRAAQIDPLHPLQLGLGPSLPSSPADAYMRLGRTDEGIEHYLRIATLRGATNGEVDAMRQAYAASGVTAFWERWLAMDMRQSGPTPDPLRMAATHVLAGDTVRALDWLEQAYDERVPGLIYIWRDPFLAPLRPHPRFLRIAAAMKLPRG